MPTPPLIKINLKIKTTKNRDYNIKSAEYNIFLFKYKVEESQQCIREKEKVSF